MGDIKEEIYIYEFIKENRGVSFAEIEGKFGSGNATIELKDKNIIIWSGLKDDVADDIIELINEEKIYAHPTSSVIYILDGKALRLPIAKDPPKEGYKELHRLPVVLDIEPPKGGVQVLVKLQCKRD